MEGGRETGKNLTADELVLLPLLRRTLWVGHEFLHHVLQQVVGTETLASHLILDHEVSEAVHVPRGPGSEA